MSRILTTGEDKMERAIDSLHNLVVRLETDFREHRKETKEGLEKLSRDHLDLSTKVSDIGPDESD